MKIFHCEKIMTVNLNSQKYLLFTIGGEGNVEGKVKVCQWNEAYGRKDQRVIAVISYRNITTGKVIEKVTVYQDIAVCIRAIEKLRKKLNKKSSVFVRCCTWLQHSFFSKEPPAKLPVKETQVAAKNSSVKKQTLEESIDQDLATKTDKKQAVPVLEEAESSKAEVQQDTRHNITLSL